MARENNVIVDSVFAQNASTTIPTPPVAGVPYRNNTLDGTTIENGQNYQSPYSSANYNQFFYLLSSVAKTLCENGVMPWVTGQAYSNGALALYSDGKLYRATRAIAANESPYPEPTFSTAWVCDNDTFLKLSGGTMTGMLDIKPPIGTEGGQINLHANEQTPTQSGIALDQYNSLFRIFGIPSADGTSVIGTGTPLLIDPYGKTITGGYSFDGNAAKDANGAVIDTTYLKLSGGTMTGGILDSTPSDQAIIRPPDASSIVRIWGHNAGGIGAELLLTGKDYDANGGRAIIRVNDGVNELLLYMYPDGRLMWGSNYIVVKRHTFYSGTVSLTQDTATVITGTHATDYHTHIAYEITSVGPGSTWTNAGVQIVTVNHEGANYTKIRVISHSATQNYALAITEIYV